MKMKAEVSGAGRPVVLVPGGLTGWLSWIPHAQRLSATRKVVRVQLLSVQFGLENHPLPADYSVKTESRALAAAIDDLHLSEPVDIMAWSFGAATSLVYSLDHPDKVRSLVLIEPPSFWVLRSKGPLDDAAKQVAARLEKIYGDITEAQLEQFAKMVGLLEPSQTGRDLPQWDLWLQHRQSLRNSPAVVAYDDDVTRLKTFQPPVLLVKGTGSAPFLHQIIDTLASFLPHREVVEYPAGHAPHIVSMDRFLEKAESFQASAGYEAERRRENIQMHQAMKE